MIERVLRFDYWSNSLMKAVMLEQELEALDVNPTYIMKNLDGFMHTLRFLQ